MKQKKILFTKEKYARLKTDLSKWRSRRVGAIKRLQEAREMGDLSENGAYKAARFEVSDIDRNIRRVETLIKNGKVGRVNGDGTVGFGNKVRLEKEGVEIFYLLVSKYESEPSENKLSLESPLGMALKGKRTGEKIVVEAPAGTISYRIKKISR